MTRPDVKYPWAVEAVGLRKAFGSAQVLDGVDLRVERGSVFAVLGPNGAGKTTTVRILSTLSTADGGTARVAGYDVCTERRAVRRRISVTGQFATLDEGLTGSENLQMLARLRGHDRRGAQRAARDLLERFDLSDAARRPVRTYSGGMRRRLDIAAGLLGDPVVVFLDEPTTGLDPRSRQAMWDIVSELAAAGVTVLLTTQYLDEADRLADRIAVIDGGRVVAEGTATDLKARVGGDRLDLSAPDLPAFGELLDALGSRAVQHSATALTVGVATNGDASAVRALLDEVDPQRRLVTRFEIHTASLDDAFFALTGHPSSDRDQEPAHV